MPGPGGRPLESAGRIPILTASSPTGRAPLSHAPPGTAKGHALMADPSRGKLAIVTGACAAAGPATST